MAVRLGARRRPCGDVVGRCVCVQLLIVCALSRPLQASPLRPSLNGLLGTTRSAPASKEATGRPPPGVPARARNIFRRAQCCGIVGRERTGGFRLQRGRSCGFQPPPRLAAVGAPVCDRGSYQSRRGKQVPGGASRYGSRPAPSPDRCAVCAAGSACRCAVCAHRLPLARRAGKDGMKDAKSSLGLLLAADGVGR